MIFLSMPHFFSFVIIGVSNEMVFRAAKSVTDMMSLRKHDWGCLQLLKACVASSAFIYDDIWVLFSCNRCVTILVWSRGKSQVLRIMSSFTHFNMKEPRVIVSWNWLQFQKMKSPQKKEVLRVTHIQWTCTCNSQAFHECVIQDGCSLQLLAKNFGPEQVANK